MSPTPSLRIQRVLKILFPLASIVLALAACVSSFTLIWGLMRSRIFPPGLEAGFHFLAARQIAEAGKLTAPVKLFSLLASVAMGFVGEFSALKATACLPLILLPLVVCFLAWRVSGSWLAGAAASWALVFYPALFPPLWMGEYPILLGLLLVTSCLLFTFVSLQDGKLSFLALVAASSAGLLASIAHLTAAAALVLTLASWMIYASLSEGRLRWRQLVPLAFCAAPMIAYFQGRGVIEPLATGGLANLFLDPVTPFLLFVCALVGAYSLRSRVGWRTPALLGLWVTATLLPSALPLPLFRGAYIFSVPPLVALAAAPFLWLKESITLNKVTESESGSSEFEVTVNANKAFGLILSSVLIAASLNYGYVFCVRSYGDNSYLEGYGDSELLDALSWVRDSTPENALIASETPLIPWVEGYAGRKTLSALASDTVLSTNFRLLTQYLVIDEWQPFTPERAPYIAAFNGFKYSRLLYIDDSYARATLSKEGEELVEAPSNCVFLGSQWLDLSSSTPGLRLQFVTSHLLIDKTLRVSADSPEAWVEYRLEARRGAQLVSFALPLWVEWGKGLTSVGINGNRVFLTIASPVESVEVEASGNVSVVEVRGGRWKPAEGGQERVYMDFIGSPDVIEARVLVRVNSARSSGLGVWTVSMAELVKEHGAAYILSPAKNPSLLSACLVEMYNEPSLYVVDSFTSVQFEAWGSEWVEAPSQGEVLFEDVQSGVGSERRFVSFETEGLYIDKTLATSESLIDLTYTIVPRENRSLSSVSLRVWIPWSRVLKSFTVEGSGASLVLDTGIFEIEVKGNVTNLDVGPDPEYGQSRVCAELSLEPDGDRVTILIGSPELISTVYEATTRPDMVGCDSLYIYHHHGMLSLAYENAKIRIYEVAR